MNGTWKIPKDKPTYILRYYLPRPPIVDKFTAQRRLEELIEFCKRTKTDAVQFFVNLRSNWYYMPDTLENTLEWACEMKKTAEAIRAEGISYQLNLQDLLGHQSGGMDMRKDYQWEFLVNQRGEVNPGCACPIGPKFREIMRQQLEAWANTKPDAIWIDDDFRLHNHGLTDKGLDWYCYCTLHLQEFSKRMGRKFTREELLEAVLKPGEPSIERLEWLDFLNETMNDTAGWISNTIHNISPETRVAQMTSNADNHSVEGRNWGDFLSNLAGSNHKPMTRPTFGPYAEIDPLEYFEAYLRYDQMRVNTFMQYKGRVDFCPEIENSRYTRWAKSYAGTRFQLWLGQLLGCRGVTLALHDLEGSPLDEEPLYEEVLVHERPALDALASQVTGDFTARGVSLITDPLMARKIQISDCCDINDFLKPEHTWDASFVQMGVPVGFHSSEDALKQEVTALDGRTAWIPDHIQMKQLLSKGVLLDSKAAEVLIKRGYGEYIGVSAVNFRNYQTGSELFHAFIIDGVADKRMPIRLSAGNWAELTIKHGAVEATTLVVPSGECFPGTVLFENSLGGRIATYAGCGSIDNEFFNHARVAWTHGLLNWLSRESFPLIVKARQRMLTLRRDSDTRVLLAFANFSVDPLREIKGVLSGEEDIKSIKVLTREGTWKDLKREIFKKTDKGKYEFNVTAELGTYDLYVLLIERG
jgi:hypothetical protein